jgi:hypothetical protein
MSLLSLTAVLQIVIAFGLLNVWIVRSRLATAYRGGGAKTLREEFAEYGLGEGMFYLVGTLKISSALLLLAGLWLEILVAPAAALVVVLMLGALAMHLKIKDPLVKALPASLMLAMSVALLALSLA